MEFQSNFRSLKLLLVKKEEERIHNQEKQTSDVPFHWFSTSLAIFMPSFAADLTDSQMGWSWKPTVTMRGSKLSTISWMLQITRCMVDRSISISVSNNVFFVLCVCNVNLRMVQ